MACLMTRRLVVPIKRLPVAFRPTILLARVQDYRCSNVRSATNTAQKSPLYLLRQKTGLAYKLCREALDKHNNDLDEAEAWLKAQALTHGYQKATKLQGRSAREGLVCMAVNKRKNLVTLVELNCETDFVARNQSFKDFAIELTQEFASNSEKCSPYPIGESELICALKPSEDHLSCFRDKIVHLISKLGENIRLARAFHFSAPKEKDVMLFGQVHSISASQSTDELNLAAGRFGAFLALKPTTATIDQARSRSEIEAIGNRLCQHVIGYSPQYIELPENIKRKLMDEERRMQEKSDQEANHDELSDEENYSSTSQNNRDDWPSMMDQTLIMSDEMTVRDYCKHTDVTIVYFERFECGVKI